MAGLYLKLVGTDEVCLPVINSILSEAAYTIATGDPLVKVGDVVVGDTITKDADTVFTVTRVVENDNVDKNPTFYVLIEGVIA